MSTYTIKYNRTTNHIAGIPTRTASTGQDTGNGSVAYYAESTCGSLTRGRFADGKTGDDLAEILAAAKVPTGRKLCTKCEKAASQALGL